MSAVGHAKTDRTSAKRQLTMSINNLKAAINDNRHVKVIEDLFDSVKIQWSHVMEKHATYLAHAYPDEEEEPDEAEKQWLNTCF